MSAADKATRLAVAALLKERQRLAFDANLFDLRLSCLPFAKNASIRRKEIDTAIAQLTGELKLTGGSSKASPSSKTEQLEMFS
jgi:hypothetical protein